MNGVCAGGTGSFIDQVASLLQTDATGLNELAKGYKVIYPIASRCGVFAKTDIQPLINEGAKKRGFGGFYFSGGCQSDYRRAGMRQAYPRTCCLPGRPAAFPFRAAPAFH